jgi:hypothetical protein
MAVELVQLPEAVVANVVSDEPLDARLEHRVDEHWAKALIERPGLVDGRVFSLTAMNARGFTGRFVPYRRVMAALADLELAVELDVAPLAVIGRTVSSDGCAVLGTRKQSLTQEPGKLEFVPSGSVDEQARIDADHVDPSLALEQELLEELAVTRSSVTALVPRVVAVDELTRVHDLVFDVHVDVTAAEISTRRAASNVGEHDRFEFVPLADLERVAGPTLGAVTRAILTLPFTQMETQ